MKCFYHSESDAVGTCKSCCKGLCASCAVDVGGGLACKSSCVEAVKSLNALIQTNQNASAINKKAGYFWPLFLIILGMAFAAAPYLSGRPVQAFPLVMGGVFVSFGIALALFQRALRRSDGGGS